MVDAPDMEEGGASDQACAICGHAGPDHIVREAEVPGNTIRETFCESCDAPCEFIPAPDDLPHQPGNL